MNGFYFHFSEYSPWYCEIMFVLFIFAIELVGGVIAFWDDGMSAIIIFILYSISFHFDSFYFIVVGKNNYFLHLPLFLEEGKEEMAAEETV